MVHEDALANVARDELPDDILRALYDYYLDLAKGRFPPCRQSFKPADVVPVLPWLVIYDVEDEPRRYKIRLQGTGISEAVGGDGTGRYLDEFPGMTESMQRLDQLVLLGRPYFVRDLPMPWSVRDYKRHHLLALPFSSDGSTVDTIMLGLSFVG